MQIDPRYGVWLSIVTAIGSAMVLCGTEFTTLFGTTGSAKILAALGLVNVAANAANAVLHMIPSANTPAALKAFALGPKVAVVAFLAVLLGAVAFAQPVQAQERKPAPKINVINDINNVLHPNTPVMTGNRDIQTLWDNLMKASAADLTYASALANAANTPAAKTRKQCWDAILAANQQANGAGLKNADGTPMVRPDPSFFSNVETLAETVDNLSPQGVLFTSCAGAAEMAKMNVLQFVAAAVGGVATFTAVP